MRKFTAKEKQMLLNAEVFKEQVELTDQERDEILKAVYGVLGTEDYYWVKGCLWETLRHMVVNPPPKENKWFGVRWLLSEMAKFAQEDYGKEISGK